MDKEPSFNSQTDEQTNTNSLHTVEACSTQDIPHLENHTVIIDILTEKESNNDHFNGRLEQGPKKQTRSQVKKNKQECSDLQEQLRHTTAFIKTLERKIVELEHTKQLLRNQQMPSYSQNGNQSNNTLPNNNK